MEACDLCEHTSGADTAPARTMEGCDLCEHTSGAYAAQLGQWKDVTCVNILVVLMLHS